LFVVLFGYSFCFLIILAAP